MSRTLVAKVEIGDGMAGRAFRPCSSVAYHANVAAAQKIWLSKIHAIYMPYARGPWLTVYRAHSSCSTIRRQIRPNGRAANRYAVGWLFTILSESQARISMSARQNTHLNTADRKVHITSSE